MHKSIYIAGPMRGYEKYNFPAFDLAKKWLEEIGWDVAISPADIDREHNPDVESLPPDAIDRAFLARVAVRDVEAIAGCDAIFMLDGWQQSKGATAELAVAKWIGLHVVYQTPLMIAENPMLEKSPEPESILEEAARITSGDRQRDYGHPLVNFDRLASLWNSYLGIRQDTTAPINAVDTGFMMLLTKIARHVNTPKRDNIVDICGYARCIAQCEGIEK